MQETRRGPGNRDAMLEVKRTLVKSAPELWAEVAEPAALARHLSPFGSVRITRAEPERLVEWEGERARGAVRLEPSGFGTRVTLAADTRPAGAPEVPEAPAEAEPPPRSLWARLLRRRPDPAPSAAPEGQAPDPASEPLMPDERALDVLAETLEALGTARHRPFSRA